MKTPKIIFEIDKKLKDNNIHKYSLEVGWFDKHFASIAKLQEFGGVVKVTDEMKSYFKSLGVSITAKSFIIPPRPHRRQTVEKNHTTWTKEFKKALIITNFNIEQSLNRVMNKIIVDYKKIFVSGDFLPISELTLLARKAEGISSTKPLYATGELRAHITGKVIKGG